MDQTSRIRRLLSPASAWLLALTTACGGAPVADTVNLTGRVTDPNGAPLAQVRVSASRGTLSTATDANGHFALGLPAAALTPGAIQFAADRFAPVGRRVPTSCATIDVVMRPYDVVQQVVLPTGAAPSVSATAARGEGTLTLSIPPDSMVTPSGAPAQGPAEVRLTYWNPLLDMASSPASLAAQIGQDGNALVMGLQSLGMASIEVVQGNDVLQVAPGRTLALDQKLPPAYEAAMAQRPNDTHVPFLFYYDMDTALWVLDGKLDYDAATGTLRGELPHLSTWNYDDFENFTPPSHCTTDDILQGRTGCAKPEDSPSLGGCMAGDAFDGNNKPLANQTVRVWLFDSEHISAINVTTDSAGHYCFNAGLRLCVPYGNNPRCQYTDNTIFFHLSSPSTPEASSLPDPIPAHCRSQSGSYNYANYQAVQYYNDCSLVVDDSSNSGGRDTPLAAPSSANIKACSYCPGTAPGSCAVSGVALSSACAQLPPVTFTPGGKPPGTPANRCKTYLQVGKECSPDPAATACCPAKTVCQDQLCVPDTNE
jgi:hypothetical protein